MRYSFLLFGIGFGFLLSRAGAATPDYYAALFLFEDLQLLSVIATAAITGGIGFAVLKRKKFSSLVGRQTLGFEVKPMKKGLVTGSLIFGIGWGLTGACPGTAPAMLGQGKLTAAFVIFGLIAGTYLYGSVCSRRYEIDPSRTAEEHS